MTLFASVLSLQRSDIQELNIKDAYSVHRAVYSLFDDTRTDEQKESGVSSGILYADQGGDARSRTILMLSDREPASQVTTRSGKLVGQVRCKELPESFLQHDLYAFRVIVNPTRRNKTDRKLYPIRPHNEIKSWFTHRATADWGFKVGNLDVHSVNILQFDNKHQQSVTLSHAKLEGQLVVQDREKFQKSFSSGLGRNGSFGCGLLQLTPIRPTLFDFN